MTSRRPRIKNVSLQVRLSYDDKVLIYRYAAAKRRTLTSIFTELLEGIISAQRKAEAEAAMLGMSELAN